MSPTPGVVGPGPGPGEDLVRRYLSALERGVTGPELAAFFTPDVEHEELPNRLIPTGARRDLAGLLEAAERGQQVMSRQAYELVQVIEQGDRVSAEVRWVGTLSAPLGALPEGGELRARFAIFLELREGKIARQRNYDCFDPF